ncbi:hypothetical protein FYK55_14300 [Roseiconus nitratireducens]|uniref:Uncharacterized protein n=1 Tax=Roseiconus nitratireducens TaxID=2605748 RepID=A0A5M6D5B2_9BACT|nr:hypothetical protein [Roseiconus nitratireducens]KAA5542698.1 hypothetical protein FYK55_14300 [Roseiconus nitratireducens]
MAVRRYRPRIEGLQARQMMAGDVALDFDSILVSKQETTQQEQKSAAAILEVRAFGEMTGASDKVVDHAVEQVTAAIESGKDVAKVTDDMNLAIVVDAMNMPKESLQSGLSANELLQFSGTLLTLDKSADTILSDPKTFVRIGQEGPKQGVENVYKRSIGNQFGVPKEVWSQFTSKQMLKGISVSELLSDDGSAAKDDKFWSDFAAVEAGKASKDDFLKEWSGGDYSDNVFDDFGTPDGTSQDTTPGDNSAPETDPGSDVPDDSLGEGLENGDDGWIDVQTDPIVTVTHTSDGGFDLQGFDQDGNAISEHFSPDGNGGFSGDQGGYSQGVPPEGSYATTTSEDGETSFWVDTSSGDDDSDNGGDSGSGDDGSDDGDGNDDDSSDDSSADSDNSSNEESDTDETPVPDQTDTPDHLLLWALMNAQSPAGQQILEMIEAAVAYAQNFGGKVDPVDEQSAIATPLLIWSLTHPDNPIGQAYLDSIGQSLDQLDTAGGVDNHPDGFAANLWDLAFSSSNIDLIMAGGGLIDPIDDSSGGTKAGDDGIVPIIGTKGGLGGTLADDDEGAGDNDSGESFLINVDVVFSLNLGMIDALASSIAK